MNIYSEALNKMATRYESAFNRKAIVDGKPTLDFTARVCRQLVLLEDGKPNEEKTTQMFSMVKKSLKEMLDVPAT